MENYDGSECLGCLHWEISLMFRRCVALALALNLFCCQVASAQSPLPGFAPGVFQSRAAIDAPGGPAYSYSFATQGVIDAANMAYSGASPRMTKLQPVGRPEYGSSLEKSYTTSP